MIFVYRMIILLYWWLLVEYCYCRDYRWLWTNSILFVMNFYEFFYVYCLMFYLLIEYCSCRDYRWLLIVRCFLYWMNYWLDSLLVMNFCLVDYRWLWTNSVLFVMNFLCILLNVLFVDSLLVMDLNGFDCYVDWFYWL